MSGAPAGSSAPAPSVVKSTRKEQQQEKVAQGLIEAFSSASDTALEAEINGVMEELRANPKLLHVLSGFVKNNKLTALLDGTLKAEDLNTPKKGPAKFVRNASKKFKHLKDQPWLVDAILMAIDPDKYNKDALEPLEPVQKSKLIYMSLMVVAETKLPHTYYPDLLDADKLCAASRQTYVKLGCPLQNVPIEQLLSEGIWHQDEVKDITCAYDKKEEKTKAYYHDFDNVEIEDICDLNTGLKVGLLKKYN